jgi:hypothetical protein
MNCSPDKCVGQGLATQECRNRRIVNSRKKPLQNAGND